MLTAGAAEAAPPLVAEASTCLDKPDFALCLVKVAGADAVTADPELAERTDLLEAAGVDLTQAPESPLTPPYDAIADAVSEVRALDRAGRSPETALAPLSRLGGLPPLVLPIGPGDAQLFAYGSLTAPNNHPSNALSPALNAAVLQAWEQALAARTGPPLAIDGPHNLAMAYRHHGDDAGAMRATALEPRLGERVEILVALDDLEAAAALAASLTPAGLLPEVHIRAEQALQFEAEINRRASAEILALLDRQIADVEAAGLADGVRFFNDLKAQALAENVEQRRPGPAELEAHAAARLAEIRWSVIEAATKAGRPQVARPLADLELRMPVALDDGEMYRKIVILAPAASPGVAAAWLDDQQARLLSELTRAPDAAHALTPLARTWAALGRKDRLEALLAKTLPLAEKARAPKGQAQALGHSVRAILIALGRSDEGFALYPGAPAERLANDFGQGRGVANLDAYLAETPADQRLSFAQRCTDFAAQTGKFDLVASCLDRAEPLADRPLSRQFLAELTLRHAALAARNDDAASADALARRGLKLAEGLDTDHSSVRVVGDLVQIAKAELRRSGRLPPRPKP